jgi:hypothetical protein
LSAETALERFRPSLPQWHAWTQHEPALAGLDYLALRGELRGPTIDQARNDELLGALVRLAQRGPHVDAAAYVVAACLLPGVRYRVARYAPSLDRQEGIAVMATALYETLRGYDVEGRPRFIASRLLATPTRRLQRAVAVDRKWMSHGRHIPDTNRHTARQVHLSGRLLLCLAVRAGVLSPRDAWLIGATRLADWSLRHAAQCLDVSYEAAKKRRLRAERRWAGWWVSEAGPAPASNDRKADKEAP